MKLANNLVKQAREGPDAGMVFKPCIPWTSRKGEEVPLCICVVSDASHGSEPRFLDAWATLEEFMSHGAKLISLADKGMVGQRSPWVHLLSFGSTV